MRLSLLYIYQAPENSAKNSSVIAYRLSDMVKLLKKSIEDSNALKRHKSRSVQEVDASLLISLALSAPEETSGIVTFGHSSVSPYSVVARKFTAFYHFGLDSSGQHVVAREYRDAPEPINYTTKIRLSPTETLRSNNRETNHPKLPVILAAKLENRRDLRTIQSQSHERAV